MFQFFLLTTRISEMFRSSTKTQPKLWLSAEGSVWAVIGSETPALGAVVVSSKASALLWGILVGWWLSDPRVLEEILLDVTVGLSKTHILSLTLLWFFPVIYRIFTCMLSVIIYVTATPLHFFVQVQIEFKSVNTRALFFPSVTLSFPYSKNLEESFL